MALNGDRLQRDGAVRSADQNVGSGAEPEARFGARAAVTAPGAATASIIASKFVAPPVLVGATTYVENAIGMSTPQILAIVAGALPTW